MSVKVDFDWEQESRTKLARRVTDRRTKVGRMVAFAADPVEGFVAWYGGKVAQVAKRNAPEDTGNLKRGVEFRWTRSGGGEVGVFGYASRYAMFVHEGTRPHWPPINAVAGWARRHGIAPFLVARAIAQHGTEAQPFLTDAIDTVNRSYLASGLRTLGPQIQKNWGG